MKNSFLFLILVLLASCEKSELEKYRELISIKTPKAVFQTIDLKTGEIMLDTLSRKWDGTRLITKVLNDFNESEKMLLMDISTYNFESGVVEEISLNYGLDGDSIRYLDTMVYEIGEIKKYHIEGKTFEIIKGPRSIFNKSKHPNRYVFISKNFGEIAILSRRKETSLHAFEQRALTKEEDNLIRTLKNDKDFFSLRKQ